VFAFGSLNFIGIFVQKLRIGTIEADERFNEFHFSLCSEIVGEGLALSFGLLFSEFSEKPAARKVEEFTVGFEKSVSIIVNDIKRIEILVRFVIFHRWLSTGDLWL